MGAIGAILMTQESTGIKKGWNGLYQLNQYLQNHKEEQTPLKSLSLSPHHLVQCEWITPLSNVSEEERIEAYLGLDVGSISTNLVVIDRNKKVLAKRT